MTLFDEVGDDTKIRLQKSDDGLWRVEEEITHDYGEQMIRAWTTFFGPTEDEKVARNVFKNTMDERKRKEAERKVIQKREWETVEEVR